MIHKYKKTQRTKWRMPIFSLIFLIIMAWLFTGYPPIWQEPRFPPVPEEASAAISLGTTSTRVQQTAANPTISITPVAADDVCVFQYWNKNSTAPTSLTETTGSDTWTAASNAGTTNVWVGQWYLNNPTAEAKTIRVDVGSDDGWLYVFCMQGTDTTTPVNDARSVSSTSASNDPSSVAITTDYNNSWIISVCGNEWSNAPTHGTGQTQMWTGIQGGSNKYNAAGTRELLASAGSDTQTCTYGKGKPEGIHSIEVREAVAATPTVSGGCFTDETEGTPCTDDGADEIKVAVNGVVDSGVDTTVDGAWSFSLSATPSSGDILTFFRNGEATAAEEATTIVKYDGTGDVDLVKMYESQLVIGADSGSANSDQTISVSDLDTATNGYENSDDEDVLYDVTAGADLTVDAEANKSEQLYIISGDTFQPASGGGSDTTTLDLEIDASAVITADSNVFTASGNWTNNGTFTANTSTITMSGTGTYTSGGSVANNLTLSGGGVTLANATHTVGGNLDMAGGSVTAGTSTVTMTGTANSIIGGSNTLNILNIDPSSAGTITLQTSDLMVGSTLTIAAGDTLTITGVNLTHTDSSDVAGTGTISGTGTIIFDDGSGGPGTNITTISSVVRFDASAGNIASTTFDARTYNGQVEIFSDNTAGAVREVAFATGTYTTSGATSHLYIINDSASYTLTLTGVTNNPTVTIGGDLDFTGTGGSSEAVITGTGTWSVAGNSDFTGGAVTFTATNTYQVSGSSKILTSNAQVYQNFTVTGGSVQNVDYLNVAGDFQIDNGATFTQAGAADILLTGDNVIIVDGGTFTKSGGSGTLIMDGVSDDQWFDDQSTGAKQDMGDVQIGTSPGTTKLKSDFLATNLTIPTGDTFETHGWEVDLSGYLDCQGTCILNLTDGPPSNEGDGTIITVMGNWTMSGSATFTTSTDSRVEPDGTADQTITTGGKAFWDFYVNNAGATDSVDDVIISGTLDVDGTLTVNDGELEMVSNNPAVNTSENVTFNTNGKVTKGTGTWTFDGTAVATYTDSTLGGPYNIGDVVFNKTSGVAAQDKVTLASNMTVDTADIQTGDTLDLAAGSYILDLVNVGATGTVLTVTGTLTPGTSTVKYSATNSGGNVNVTTTTYDSLQISGNETYDMTGNLTSTNAMPSDLTIDLNATLDSTTNNYDINIAGSWNNNGTFTVRTSIVTFDSGDAGETIDAGSSGFYDAVFNSGSGGWTIQNDNMTVSNNLTLTAASAFTVNSGITLEVDAVFDLSLPGANTTWTGSTLYLNGSGGMYDINTKSHGGDVFATLRVGASEDISMWDSSATIYTMDSGGCLFSQDHGTTAGRLNIYGTCNSRTNEYWSYAKDFDGAAVTRQADVRFVSQATLTVDNGDTLEIIGQSAGANRSAISYETTAGYGLTISGTINAQYYDFDYLNASGLNITSSATVTELSDGSFDNNILAGSYITVTGITQTKTFTNNVFDDNADGGDINVVYNVNADGGGISWTFTGWSGNVGGEAYDNEANGAVVDWGWPELTLTLNANTVYLGIINTNVVGSDNHTISVSTNAVNGYTCKVVEDGELRYGANTINDVADGTVSAGSEEYGLSCSGADCQLGSDSSISGTPLTVASNAGVVTDSITTMTYEAAADSSTIGGKYSHEVIYTCSGDF